MGNETAQNPSLVPRIDPSLAPDPDPSLDPSPDPGLHHETRDQSLGSLRETRDPAPEVSVETTGRGKRLDRSRLWPTVTVRGLNLTPPRLKPPQRKMMMKTN